MQEIDRLINQWDNKANLDLLVKEYNQGRIANDMSVIPFIGAGLSAFCYPAWGRSLQQLIDEFGADNTEKLNMLLHTGKFEKVADLLSESDERRFYMKFREMYGLDKLYKYLPLLHKQAVGLMPFLFPASLIMTSNFDPVLEAVYDSVQLATSDIFKHPEILNNPNNILKIFKIHGDVLSSNDNIVFSGKSYRHYYRYGSKLVVNLKKLFQEKSILFLGASLDKDRTIDVLKKASGHKPHFAIIECEWTDEAHARRKRELNSLGILPIFYPKGEYHCVYILLNELLKSVNPSGIIEGRFGAKFYVNDGFVARITDLNHDNKKLDYFATEYNAYDTIKLNKLLQCAVIAYNQYMEKHDDTNLAKQAAGCILHLVRCQYFDVFNVIQYFNPIDALRELTKCTSDEYIVRIYAESLTWNKDLYKLDTIKNVVNELAQLYNEYVADVTNTSFLQDVALIYASALSGLTDMLMWSSYSECIIRVDNLKKLYAKYGGVYFAIPYARGLWSIYLGELQVSLSEITDKCREAKKELKLLLDKNDFDGILLSIYARMLINAISVQDIEDSEETMNELFELFVQEKTDDIATWCAQGLLALSLKYDKDFESRRGALNALYYMSQEYSHVELIIECTRRAFGAFKFRMDDMRNYESENYDPYDPYNILNAHIDMANGQSINLTPWWANDDKKLKKIKYTTFVVIGVLILIIVVGIAMRCTWLWIGAIVGIVVSFAFGVSKYFKVFGRSIDKMFK